MIKKMTMRIFVLLAIVFGAQVAMSVVFPERGVPTPVKVCDAILEAGTDILYFGDSTLYRGHPSEGNSPTLPQLLDGLLPDLSVRSVAHDAYHPVLYAAFCRYIATKPSKPKLVIVPLNLRAFSVERDRRPEYQFAREQKFLNNDNALFRAFFTPLAVWGIFNLQPISLEDYLDTPVGEPGITVRDLSPDAETGLTDDNRRDFIRLCYRYTLTPEHRQLLAIREITETCRDAGIELLFYLTPVDYELGDRLYGDEFSELIRNNVATIAKTIEESGGRFLDLSTRFGHRFFTEETFPDAYLRNEGKQAVADGLAAVVAQELQNRV